MSIRRAAAEHRQPDSSVRYRTDRIGFGAYAVVYAVEYGGRDGRGQETIMNADQDEGRIDDSDNAGMNVAGEKVKIEKSERKGAIQNVSGTVQTWHGNLKRYLCKVM